MIRCFLARILICSILWTTSAVAAPALAQTSGSDTAKTPASLSDEGIWKRFEHFANLLAEFRTTLRRSAFDPQALLEELDYEAERIVRFVTEDVRFEQYPGAMRGATGALMSRAGNAADQALLLATLLKDAGFAARIARGELSDAAAAELVSGMRPQTESGALFRDEARAKEILSQLRGEAGNGAGDNTAASLQFAEPSSHPIHRQARAAAGEVISQLSTGGLSLPDSGSIEPVVREARDYFWVQWRDEASAQWQDLHPAFGASTEPPEPTPSTVFADRLPADLLHTVQIRLRLERSRGGDREVILLGETPRLPTANLGASPVMVTLAPANIGDFNELEELPAAVEATRMWLPLLNGVPGKLGFDLLGNTVDIEAASSAYAELFQTLAGGLARGIEGLGGEKPRLEALWLDYQISGPNGEEKLLRTDLVSDSLRSRDRKESSAAEMSARISGSHSVMLATGSYPDSYLVDVALERLVETMRTLHRLAPDVSPQRFSAALESLETSYLGQLDLYAVVDALLASKDTITYRDEPSLITYSRTGPLQGGERSVINIVTNGRRSFASYADGLSVAPQHSLAAGVLESIVEEALLTTETNRTLSAASALLEHGRQGKSFALIRSMDSQRFKTLDTATARWVRSDLDSGFVVLMPEVEWSSSDRRAVWWRVDPTSGETLAMMSGGYGGVVLTEYMKTRIVGGAALAGFFTGYLGCTGGQAGANQASTSKNLSCALCGVWAGATAALAVGTVVYGGLAIFQSWLFSETITVSAGAVLRAQILGLAETLVGYYCGVVSASG